ncbi:MAG: cation:proton antiporter [Planctomycetes bacterium]|nr:cation:proton antiporter [Planctomycetota bacterium]
MRRAAGLLLAIGLMLALLAAERFAQLLPQARAVYGLGFLLIAGCLAGDVVAALRLPRITGYILAGVLFGPHALGFLDAGVVADLKLIDDLALSFIALAAGGELRLGELRARRRVIALTASCQMAIACAGVALVVLLAGPLLPFVEGRPVAHLLAVAAILGAFAPAASPAAAIAVISECRARGPFTEVLLGVTVVMDVLVILVFAAVVSLCQTLVAPGSHLDLALSALVAAEVLGAVLAGILLGLLIALYMRHVRADLLVFILGVAFLTTFFSRQLADFLDRMHGIPFHLEPMLICITAGLVVQNASRHGGLFLEAIDRASLPVYVVFFCLAGAALDLGALATTWLAAVLITVLRVALLWASSWLGGRLGGDPPAMARASGWAFITQAAVGLGCAGIVQRRFPDWGNELAALMVAVIGLSLLAGPAALKLALNAVKETREARDAHAAAGR